MQNEEIKTALSALLDDIAVHTADRCDEEIRLWLMAASFKIWAANKLFSDDYVRVVSALRGEKYSTAQFITALDCAGGDCREMDVPQFFRSVVEKDKADNTDNSRTITDSIRRFLVSVALINGDFTLAEADALRQICNTLAEYCDFHKIAAGKVSTDPSDLITPLNKSSYYEEIVSENETVQKQFVLNGEKVSLTPSNTPSQNGKSNDSSQSITLNLNLLSDDFEIDSSDDESDGVKSDDESEGEGIVKKSPASMVESGETLESVLEELNRLVGLDKVKSDVHSLLNFIKVCQLRIKRGMKVPTISYHLVFTGNPGTGKTTVARMVAKLYYLMGILPQGQLVETDRSGLVAGYLGQTAIKTQKVIQEALGGVLFIDEAYSLANDKEDSYGKEAIETILKAMEDHRDELVVIVAGYDDLMHKFIDSNPGLRSRFNKYFNFPDYDGDDLLRIFNRFCEINGYSLAKEAVPVLTEKLNELYEHREEHFGNARAVRNLFEHAINRQANRLVSDNSITDQELAELTLDDILPAMEVM